MSLRSGAGLDGLQARCCTGVFGELDWSPGVHQQCEGRLLRSGQTKPVFTYYVAANSGADPVMIDVLGVKRGQLEGVRDPDGDAVVRTQPDPDRIKELARGYLAGGYSARRRTPCCDSTKVKSWVTSSPIPSRPTQSRS